MSENALAALACYGT